MSPSMNVTKATDSPDLTAASAARLARLIREKQVSAVEVVEAHLARISEVDGRLNAVAQLTADSAFEEARPSPKREPRSKRRRRR